MAKIFQQQADVKNHPSRNNFDLRFDNYLTFKMGQLVPVMCKPVNPGESFEINPSFGFQFMPMPFPVASPLRAHLHFFYVRNKNIWKDWPNFLEGLDPELIHPYIDQGSEFFKTGSLADFLDIPTTLVSSGAMRSVIRFDCSDLILPSESQHSMTNSFDFISDPNSPFGGQFVSNGNSIHKHWAAVHRFSTDPDNVSDSQLGQSYSVFVDFFESGTYPCFVTIDPINTLIEYNPLSGFSSRPPVGSSYTYLSSNVFVFDGKDRLDSKLVGIFSAVTQSGGVPYINFQFDRINNGNHYHNLINFINSYISSHDGANLWLVVAPSSATHDKDNFDPSVNFDATMSLDSTWLVDYRFWLDFIYTSSHDLSSFPDSYNPFLVENPDGIRISALPFRAYESCYYAYYANSVLQPLLRDGKPVYNEYNTDTSDGADKTDYHIFSRNYELDFMTSCLPSPQQGNAPLVGMTALGNITIEDENGVSTWHATTDNDGNISKIVATSPAASANHARTAMNMVAAGMNINDFRSANGLQRFLEQSLRSGYRYVDFIKGQFGVGPRHSEMDMPEFIGGMSRDVNVMKVTQTANISQSSRLGDYAGQAQCVGSTPHTIRHYCDDYGWIIGICCVTPIPAYSQLLPKHFAARERLDYYNPIVAESLPMQPVTYQEVAPIEAYKEYVADNNKKITDTFGYQRPNYDLIAYTDQVHGQFRMSMADYLVSRRFNGRPELGRDFIEIHPDEVNHIFNYTEADEDTIIGDIHFDIKAKRPIHRIYLPSLGR